jgi:hypothetical protein
MSRDGAVIGCPGMVLSSGVHFFDSESKCVFKSLVPLKLDEYTFLEHFCVQSNLL